MFNVESFDWPWFSSRIHYLYNLYITRCCHCHYCCLMIESWTCAAMVRWWWHWSHQSTWSWAAATGDGSLLWKPYQHKGFPSMSSTVTESRPTALHFVGCMVSKGLRWVSHNHREGQCVIRLVTACMLPLAEWCWCTFWPKSWSVQTSWDFRLSPVIVGCCYRQSHWLHQARVIVNVNMQATMGLSTEFKRLMYWVRFLLPKTCNITVCCFKCAKRQPSTPSQSIIDLSLTLTWPLDHWTIGWLQLEFNIYIYIFYYMDSCYHRSLFVWSFCHSHRSVLRITIT